MRNGRVGSKVAVALVVTLAACAGGDTDSGGAAVGDGSGGAATVDSPSADVQFLRQMSDHHQGLVLISEQAHTRAQDDSVRTVAENFHMKQAAERDSMIAMLSEMFNEQHTPEAMAKNRAQADSVSGMSGTEADRYYLQTVIGHHREGIATIDQQMPSLSMDHVRTMAERMRSDQQREIQELEGKLESL